MRHIPSSIPFEMGFGTSDTVYERLRRVVSVVSDARVKGLLSAGDGATLIRCCGAEAVESCQLVDGMTVGRSSECAWPIADGELSRRHFCIRHEAGQWTLHDCDSKNGVFVNGHRVASRPLADGDWIEAGGTVFVYTTE